MPTMCWYLPEYPLHRRCNKTIIRESTGNGKECKENESHCECASFDEQPNGCEGDGNKCKCQNTHGKSGATRDAPFVETSLLVGYYHR
jgi:hypothetical protein